MGRGEVVYRSNALDPWPVIVFLNADICKVIDNIGRFNASALFCRSSKKQCHRLLQMKALQFEDVFRRNCSVQPCTEGACMKVHMMACTLV